jgi:signal transduction histidine kinase
MTVKEMPGPCPATGPGRSPDVGGYVGAPAVEAEALRGVCLSLHDGPVQTLCAAALALERARRKGDPASSDAETERGLRLVDDALAEIREVMVEFGPSPDGGPLLSTQIASLAHSCRDRWDFEVTVTSVGRSRLLMPRCRITAFRIVQEALNNARRHSGASEALVALGYGPAGLTAVVDDRGVGFDRRAAGHGLGVLGMCDRAQSAGGVAEVLSEPGRGTTVIAWIPSPVGFR